MGAFVKTALSACGIVDKKRKKEKNLQGISETKTLKSHCFMTCLKNVSAPCQGCVFITKLYEEKNFIFKSILALFSDLFLHFVVVGVFFLPTLNLCRDR